ncbi:MAG: hypothetical protein AB1578_14465 [Thermodesulfobacteriota bacterium]|jgi:hypothetical protein
MIIRVAVEVLPRAGHNCAECHADVARSFVKNVHNSGTKACVNCHMHKATRSAITVATYIGDIRTHIFRINTDPNASMFRDVKSPDGTTKTFAEPFVTVEYACLSCHAQRDKAWAASNAKGYHKKP